MVDVKHGGIRKDLSLLFASESLPIEYNEVPYLHMIIQKVLIGITLNAIIIYIKRSATTEVEIILKLLIFGKMLGRYPKSQVKYTDLPIPVLARMQVIFSLHKQRNTWNGSYISELEPYTPLENN